jgi:hypothetical protein
VKLLARVHAFRLVFGLSSGRVPRFLVRPARALGLICFADDGSLLPPARIVLGELARFCRASKPTVEYDAKGRVDPLASARMDGRREVFLWIQEHLHLDDRTLLQLQHEEHDDGR